MTVPGLAACLVFMTVGLAACQLANSGTGGQKGNIAAVREQGGTGQIDQGNHAAKGENAQDIGTPRGQEAAPGTSDIEAGQGTAAEQQEEDGLATADQWQTVPGYGIRKKGESVLYVLDMDASRMKTDERGIGARLLSTVFQDNVINVRVKLKDDTVTLTPDEKVKEILKQEEENQKKQDRGTSVQWDDSYSCIDSGKDIYGRSAFQDRTRVGKKEQEAQGARAVTFDRIKGKDIDGLGFTWQRNSISYKDGGKSGFYTSQVSENTMGKDRSTLDKPGGVYELWLNGLEDPIKVVSKKTPAYDSLEDIKGVVNHEGFYGMAEGIMEEDGFRLTAYTYLENGYRTGFSRGRLMATLSDGRAAGLIPVLGEQLATSLDQLSGIQPKSTQETLYGRSGGIVVTEASLRVEKPAVIPPEQRSVLETPIPGERQPLGVVVEFRDYRIYLTGISPMDELYEHGADDNGNPLTKYMVYIDVRTEMRDADKNLYYVSTVQSEEGQGGNSGDPIKVVYALADMAGVDRYSAGELAGFKVLYEEGGPVIHLQLQRSTYGWNQESALPVQM